MTRFRKRLNLMKSFKTMFFFGLGARHMRCGPTVRLRCCSSFKTVGRVWLPLGWPSYERCCRMLGTYCGVSKPLVIRPTRATLQRWRFATIKLKRLPDCVYKCRLGVSVSTRSCHFALGADVLCPTCQGVARLISRVAVCCRRDTFEREGRF
jgi:hypothetical protein